MAKLLKCPDCGGKVSARADDCPHCGCPMDEDEDEGYGAVEPKSKVRPSARAEEAEASGYLATRPVSKRDMATGCGIGCLIWPIFGLVVVPLLEWLLG